MKDRLVEVCNREENINQIIKLIAFVFTRDSLDDGGGETENCVTVRAELALWRLIRYLHLLAAREAGCNFCFVVKTAHAHTMLLTHLGASIINAI